MFDRIIYYLVCGERSVVACILSFLQPLLMALEDMLPDIFVRGAEELLQGPVSCRIELP